jgi:hypothetical protein
MAQWYRIHDVFDETTLYVLRDALWVYSESLDAPTTKQNRETADIWGIEIADGIVDVEALMGDEKSQVSNESPKAVSLATANTCDTIRKTI